MACRSLLLFVLAIASSALAQQPGFLASPFAPANQTTTTLAAPPAISPHDRLMDRLWVASAVTMVAATSADAATSWNHDEANGILASRNGGFGAKGLGIKVAVAGALLIPQYFLRHHTEFRSKFIAANFVEAGIFGGTSVHNVRVVNSLK